MTDPMIEINRLTEELAVEIAHADAALLRAAIQAHHDLKHGNAGGRSAAVLVPGDRALYEAAGIKHAVLGFEAGLLDDVRRGGRRALGDV